MFSKSIPTNLPAEPAGAESELRLPQFEMLEAARRAFFADRDPQAALQALLPVLSQWNDASWNKVERRALADIAGAVYFQLGHYEPACDLYAALGDFYMAGYAQMLAGKLEKTAHWWEMLKNVRENHWAISLYGLITRKMNTWPTFFQIRNHIEADVGNLIRANRQTYLENMLIHTELLAQINPEVYKLVGRALMHSGLVEPARIFLMKGQRACPQDPEVYFHLAQCLFSLQRLADTRLLLQQSLMMNPSYYPAEKLLEIVVGRLVTK